jgi:predicted MPP superfamily phosphohydrolase
MSPWLRVVFIGVALLLLYGMHRYFWARFVRDVGLSRRWKIAATCAVIVLGLSLPAAFLFSRRTLGGQGINVALEAYVWLGLLFYCVLLLAAVDLLRLAYGVPKQIWKSRRVSAARDATTQPDAAAESAPDRELAERPVTAERALPTPIVQADAPRLADRRVFLARAVAGTAALGSGGIAIGGYHSAMNDITTPEIPVHLSRLPRELSGYRILHLSDLHLGPTLAGRFLERVVEKANAQKPDLVVITGDLVDARVATLGATLAPFGKLAARHGIVFVTGNHEYYSGADEWIEFLRQRGIRVLMNERMEIGDKALLVERRSATESEFREGPTQRASFDLAGVPDQHAASYYEDDGPDLARALVGRDPDRELVFLAHQPVQIEMAAGKHVGLQLSGHTHGGQMWPFGALVALAQPYVAGLHRHTDGTQIYVSRGTGFWGPPLRVANPAEIATIVLVAG